MLKLLVVVGTRPEIIKMAPIVQEGERRSVEIFLLHTGQHYSQFMSDSFFDDLGLRTPDRNLQIGSGTQAEQTAKALVGVEKEIENQKPDAVLVQGDTNAVLSAALASVKLHVPVGHVEAGLRSYDIRMPEEHNRRLTDHISSYLFAPTDNSARILEKENVWGKIYVTGNTVIDTLEDVIPVARKRESIAERLGFKKFVLLTMHRAENVDKQDTLDGLVKGLLDLEMDIVFAAHPRTVTRLKAFDLMKKIEASGRIHIIEPPGYLDFLKLMESCDFVLTDSGGIQEEVTAPSLNKSVFVLRTSTERHEAVESGHATIVGVNPDEFTVSIKDAIKKGLDKKRPCPYGAGDASVKILDILEKEL